MHQYIYTYINIYMYIYQYTSIFIYIIYIYHNIHRRKVKAATGIQTLIRRFLRRLKTMRRMAQEKRIQEMEALMSEEGILYILI